MNFEELTKKIRAEFDSHSQSVIERDVRRLSRLGEIEFDSEQYVADSDAFISDMSSACAVDTKSITVQDFDEWYNNYNYEDLFPNYCKTYPNKDLLRKKAFEHWLSIEETKGAPSGDFLDVGCATSPFHELWKHLDQNDAGRCFQVDLPLPEYGYKPGVHGNIIGSTADDIPLLDESVSRIYSHNAIEHFEGAAYTGFFQEAARLLRPGGVIYICPLFVASTSFAFVSLTGIYRRLSFPKIPAGLKLVYSDAVGQPYALQIDSTFLKSKIVQPLAKKMDFELIRYSNREAHEYGVTFALKGTKKSPS